MSRLTRDGTAESVSRNQILRHVQRQGNIHFPSSAYHEQDWQPYPVDLYSAICHDHTYIHTYIRKWGGCVGVVIPLFWTSGLWTYQPGSHRRKVTQEEGHTGLLHLPSAVLALIFIARTIQPFLSLVDREVVLCVPTK